VEEVLNRPTREAGDDRSNIRAVLSHYQLGDPAWKDMLVARALTPEANRNDLVRHREGLPEQVVGAAALVTRATGFCSGNEAQ
jgi:hypothetical protein